MSRLISIIPVPAKLELTGGEFLFSGSITTRIDHASGFAKGVVNWLCDQLKNNYRFSLMQADSNSDAVLIEFLHDPSLSAEGSYNLNVADKIIALKAGTAAGFFYAAQTLLQLFPLNAKSDNISIPCLKISDYPRFRWRGIHLDVSRHFFPVDFIKKLIDLLAFHKMNIFHWHLTDDQGWRIEINKYPRLTEIGAWRIEPDGKRYGGFYTQSDIREVVEYARRRFITIVPEIELPGHATAALAAYPEYSCTSGQFKVANTWGVFDDVYCPGNDKTFLFLENILAEVAELFPGKYLHIGGDECPKVRWQNHDLCQQLMKRSGLHDYDDLQALFIARIARHINSLGKSLVGWDEILDGGAPQDAVIMAWRNAAKGVEAAQAGNDVVMTPMTHCYFDHYQGKVNEPKAIGGFTPLNVVYEFEPVPDSLANDLHHHIIGAQGNIWTEYMHTSDHVEYMAFPRACALAEALWSPQTIRSWPGFQDRLREHLKRLDRIGVNYRKLSD